MNYERKGFKGQDKNKGRFKDNRDDRRKFNDNRNDRFDRNDRNDRRRFEDDRKEGFRERVDERENVVKGRNPVIEAVKAARTIEKLYVQKGINDGQVKLIISMAKEKNAAVSEVEKKVLDDIAGDGGHQGVVALVSDFVYSTVEEILASAKEKGESPFVVILDEVEDPHNLGSIIRSANVLGAHGIIVPKRRSALITATVAKASAGAVEHTKVAKVTNITQTINQLKKEGLWIIGTDMDGESAYKSNLTGPIGIVIGNEGSGISRLVKDNCDLIVSIPVLGEIESLNASVACGIVLYEVVRQRNK